MEVLTPALHPIRPLPPSAEEQAEAVADALLSVLTESEAGWDCLYDLRSIVARLPAEVVTRAIWLATGAAIGGAS
jgi:hypothetical protein